MTTEIDKRAQLLYARNEGTRIGMERGTRIGMELGMKKGKAEGKIEGKAEGRLIEKQETARRMKSIGMDVSVIVQVTGLSESEIIEA